MELKVTKVSTTSPEEKLNVINGTSCMGQLNGGGLSRQKAPGSSSTSTGTGQLHYKNQLLLHTDLTHEQLIAFRVKSTLVFPNRT